ncbi:MAG: signal peptide peptidase SppA [Pseudomonadales bacterium]|nr:signal peptide peptidase SppA [Pseudomonadales bacterium]
MTTSQTHLMGRIGGAITKLRNFVVNSLFVLVLVFLVIAALSTCQSVSVPSNSALLINPKGLLVEERSYPDALQDLLQSGPRQIDFNDILTAITRAKTDPDIKLIVLDVDELYGISPARASRVGAALSSFRESGKKVVSFAKYYDQSQYYLASFSDALYMHPMGQIVLQGFGSYSLYFNELLSNFDVNVHIFRVGEYKSAVEPLLRNDMSEASRQASEVLYNDLWQHMIGEVANNRSLQVHDIDAYAQQLPTLVKATNGDMARAALESNLVDELLTSDQVRVRIADDVGVDATGEGFNGIDYNAYLAATAPGALSSGSDNIAVLVAQGPIMLDGPPGQVASADELNRLIRQARYNKKIKALVVRIDSPGGGQLASELIRQELELFQLSGRPVVASFGSVAASGGYWIAATADEIVAEATTITGSIGIFSYLTTFEDTLKRYGIHTDGVGSTDNVIGIDPLVGVSDDMAQILQSSVERGYEQFVQLVARGRNKTPEEIEYVAQGRVWSGAAALDLGLVDSVGGLNDALARAAEVAGLEDYRTIRLTPQIDPRQQFLAELMQTVGPNLLPHLVPNTWSDNPKSVFGRVTTSLNQARVFNDPGKLYAYCLSCPTTQP